MVQKFNIVSIRFKPCFYRKRSHLTIPLITFSWTSPLLTKSFRRSPSMKYGINAKINSWGKVISSSLCEMCPNTELFLVRIFPHSDWIWRDVSLRIQSECGKIRTRKNSVFGHFSRSACLEDYKTTLHDLFHTLHDFSFISNVFIPNIRVKFDLK